MQTEVQNRKLLVEPVAKPEMKLSTLLPSLVLRRTEEVLLGEAGGFQIWRLQCPALVSSWFRLLTTQ